MRAFLLSLFIFAALFADSQDVIYIHPKNNSQYISPSTTLLVRTREQTALHDFQFRVYGEKSGMHTGKIVYSENTIIFTAHNEFAEHERVHIHVQSACLKAALTWSFQIGEHSEYEEPKAALQKTAAPTASTIRLVNGVAVPFDFPEFQPSRYNLAGVDDGKIFITNWTGTPYFMILENDGTPYFYRRAEAHTRGFKVQPNGLLTRFSSAEGRCFYGMDSTFKTIKTFKPVHGYTMDEHEFQWLKGGHYMFIAYGYRKVDMSKVVSGGNPNASIKDCHIQEFDENDNLVFEWLGFEHLDIRNSINVNLKSGNIDWMHSNSLAVDYDGNIIMSIRHFSQIIKIDRQTGDILWRLGGKTNEFDFVNDEFMTSYQHDARPVPGKPNHYTAMDNGNFHNPRFSRAVEFQLDMENMTATRVWEYRLPDGNTGWMGNAQRLPNGNTFINWADASVPKATEVTPEGKVVYEGDYVIPDNCYRTFRFDWHSSVDRPFLHLELLGNRIGLIFNKFGDENIKEYEVWGGLSRSNMSLLATTDKTWYIFENPENYQNYYFKVRGIEHNGNKSRSSEIKEIYASYVPPGENMLRNGDFSNGMSLWKLYAYNPADADMQLNDNGELEIDINNGGDQIWSVQLVYEDLPLIQGLTYRFEFDAFSSSNKPVDAKLETNGTPWTNYGRIRTSTITRVKKHFSYEFTMQDVSDPRARIVFNCGSTSTDMVLDNVSLTLVETSAVDDQRVVDQFALKQNYPNPFNAGTTIDFELPRAGRVQVVIYDMLGREITLLTNAVLPSGLHTLHWNGKNASGHTCTSGLYFLSVEYEDVRQKRKLLLVK